MTNVLDTFPDVHLSVTDDGTWVAATNRSPYFLIEADSEEAILRKVKSLLDFYQASSSGVSKTLKLTYSIRQFVTTRKISARDLADLG